MGCGTKGLRLATGKKVAAQGGWEVGFNLVEEYGTYPLRNRHGSGELD